MPVALRYSQQREQFVLVADQTDGPKIAAQARGYGFKFDSEIKQFATRDWWKADKFRSLAAPECAPVLRKRRQYYDASCDKGALGEKLNIELPEGKQLLPFQKSGVLLISDWTRRIGSVLLCDEQGLGKTPQFIASTLLSPGTTLVVCPSFATYMWQAQFYAWTNFTGDQVHVVETGMEDPLRFDSPVVIVGYSLVAKHAKRLHQCKWMHLGVDEAHRCKNSEALRSQAVLGFNRDPGFIAERNVYMSGTIVTRRPSDLYNVLSRRFPGILGPYGDWLPFIRRYCGAYHNGLGWVYDGKSNLDELNMRLRSGGMIRRLKKDVQPQLPPRFSLPVPLKTPPGLVQINKRHHAKTTGTSWSDMRKLQDLFKQESFFGMLAELVEPKAPLVARYVGDLLDEDCDKIFMVYRHSYMGRYLAEELAQYGVVHIHGGVPMKKRPAMQELFQSKAEGSPRLLIGQMEAVKEALTFTAADTVVFAELTTVPGDISQIVDRVHRIGQDSDKVTAHFPYMRGTIEEHMAATVIAAADDIKAITH